MYTGRSACGGPACPRRAAASGLRVGRGAWDADGGPPAGVVADPGAGRHTEHGTERRTRELFDQADALANRIGHPHALGMVQLAAGLIALDQTRFADAMRHCEAAEEIFRTQCTGVLGDQFRVNRKWLMSRQHVIVCSHNAQVR